MEDNMPTQKKSDTSKSSSSSRTNYINNPFNIVIEGSRLLFRNAPILALMLAFLAALSAPTLGDFQPTATDETDATITDPAMDPLGILGLVLFFFIFAFGVLVIASFIAGVYAYTAAELAKGREVSVKRAVKATRERFWSFVWLQLLIIVKVVLWSLLFIIPGIVKAFRYSLAGVSFFDSDKKLTGNAAIKDSIALTKGAWITTFGAQTFFNIITLGMISPIVDTTSKAILYRQFTALEKSGKPKESAHILSRLTLGFCIFAVTFYIVVLIITEVATGHLLNAVSGV